MSLRGIVTYVSAALFWAAFFVLFTVSVGSLGPALTVGIFAVVGGISLLGMAKVVGRPVRLSPHWGAVILWAFLGWTILGTAVLAMGTVGAAVSAVVISSIPLFGTVAAQMGGHDRVTGLGAISLLLGISGLLLVVGFPSGGASWSFIGGVLAALIAAITAGSSGRTAASKLGHPYALETVAFAAIIGGVGALAISPLTPGSGKVGAGAMIIVAALGAFCAFLGLFAMSAASDKVRPRIAATLPGVGTVLTVIAGVAMLHEAFSVPQFFGMVLILAGTALLRGLVPNWFPATWRA